MRPLVVALFAFTLACSGSPAKPEESATPLPPDPCRDKAVEEWRDNLCSSDDCGHRNYHACVEWKRGDPSVGDAGVDGDDAK